MCNFTCEPVSCPSFFPYRIGTIEPIRLVFVRWSFHVASLERMDCCFDTDDFRKVCVCVFPHVFVLLLHGMVWIGVDLRIVWFLTMSFIFPSDMLLFFRSACTLRDSSGGVHTRSMSRFAVPPILSWEPTRSIAQPPVGEIHPTFEGRGKQGQHHTRGISPLHSIPRGESSIPWRERSRSLIRRGWIRCGRGRGGGGRDEICEDPEVTMERWTQGRQNMDDIGWMVCKGRRHPSNVRISHRTEKKPVPKKNGNPSYT